MTKSKINPICNTINLESFFCKILRCEKSKGQHAF